MSHKKTNVIVAESGAEFEIDLPLDNLEQCRAAIFKEVKTQSFFMIDELGTPLLSNHLLMESNTTTFYIIEIEPNVDAKIINSDAVIKFHKASVLFLKYVLKDASVFYESLCTKTTESTNKITEAVSQRTKNLNAIAELKIFSNIFTEDVEALKKSKDAALKGIENTYSIEVSRILSDFKRGIVDYTNKVCVYYNIERERERC